MGKYVNQKIINDEQGNLNIAKAIADLNVSNAKKDALIQQLTGTIANLNIEIAQIKGGTN
ncbi:hypothetical protein KM803_13015 [Clostridium tyrobutyricum]|uniref:hypothetical protein n=1 Tax=Clostridium tyrobutyricum TaxID=1519 RepID=UPI0010A9AB5F|nr:hypothetical protein [Clostridium tyrobutyricum]MBV4432238.1 hypothetical protein [Clostridium tyrobutyricum]QCH29170.1 hypothetical protein EZN00_02803 [Clostridium tyrobutyricum]